MLKVKTLADALSKQLLTKRYGRGEAIRIDELLANKQQLQEENITRKCEQTEKR